MTITRRQLLKATGAAAAAYAAGIKLRLPEQEEVKIRREQANALNFEMPDMGETRAICPSVGLIAFASVHYDECAENPLEGRDGVGQIYSFRHRHCNYARWIQYCNSVEDIHEHLDEEYPDGWVPLGYFEHGRCIWHLSGDIPFGTEVDYRWDGVSFAGYWVPDEHLLNWLPDFPVEKHQGKLQEWAAQACDVYTHWCNGEIYGYTMSLYAHRPPFDRESDYRYDTPLYEDSRWGYYGWEYFEDQVRAAYLRMVEHAEPGA